MRGATFDGGAVGDVSGAFTFGSEFICDLDSDGIDFDVAPLTSNMAMTTILIVIGFAAVAQQRAEMRPINRERRQCDGSWMQCWCIFLTECFVLFKAFRA